ncbi:MAG: response regulator [Bacteroidetes bacterium]|nr:response regulator [Bacteroidota bacterium]
MPKKILVVDDEDSLRKSIAIMLRLRGGYEVLEASDGLIGVDTALAEKPDLIISDVYMDNMNGFMMIDEIQSTPDGAKIPVIMMTSAAQGAGAWKSGAAVEYLDKGFTLPQLLEVVKRILGE